MSKSQTLADHEVRIAALEATIERAHMEVITAKRHVATLCRASRRALNDNRDLRIAIKTVLEQRDLLVQHIAKCAPDMRTRAD